MQRSTCLTLWRWLLVAGGVMGAGLIFGRTAAPVPTQAAALSNTAYLPLVRRVEGDVCDNPPFNDPVRYNMDHIDAPEAWACYWEGQAVVVAILDTGIDLTHPELAPNLTAGKSFIANHPSPDDDNGHGSHVAGIVAAVANNGGVIGVAPEARLMPVKVLNFAGSGTDTGVASGIIWAVNNGAQIINLSLGSVYNSPAIADAVSYAAEAGVVIVAAAGNCGDHNYPFNGCNYEDQPSYPAALPEVIAVAATTESRQQASFSTSGSYVEVAAPGSNIFSTYAYGEYALFNGTSQASPHVAGLAALIWAHRPEYAAAQVRSAISSSAVDLGPAGFDEAFGYGLINALAAVQLTYPPPLARASRLPLVAPEPTAALFAPGELLVRLARTTDVAEVWRLATDGAPLTILETLPELDLWRLATPPGQELALIARLTRTAGVLLAAPNYLVQMN